MVHPNGRNGFYQRKNRSSTSRQRKHRNCADLFDDESNLFCEQATMQESILLIQPTFVELLTLFVSGFNLRAYDQVYSNGHSEIILGKAIKQLGLPRDEIVVMTKACVSTFHLRNVVLTFYLI